MNQKGWATNGILVTVVLVLAAIALIVFLIANIDVNVKG